MASPRAGSKIDPVYRVIHKQLRVKNKNHFLELNGDMFRESL
jgi:hypothetical protein